MRIIPLAPKLFLVALCLATGIFVIDPVVAVEPAGESIWLPNVLVDYYDLSVDPTDKQESLAFYRNFYLPSEGVGSQWTGDYDSCNAGDTSDEYKAAVRMRVNYFRAMAGVPADIMFMPEYSAKAQEAALMMSRNGDSDHHPPSSWECYSYDGATAARKSNLYWGMSGAEAITGYMEDPGDSNYYVGHRRWILCPQSRYFGTGDITGTTDYHYRQANVLWVFDDYYRDLRPTTREEFVAWPPPGYVPGPLIFPRWSFSYDDADFSRAIVEITSRDVQIPIRLEQGKRDYCENTLVWILDVDWKSVDLSQDRSYEVTVRDVVIEGQTKPFSYVVTVFDPQ